MRRVTVDAGRVKAVRLRLASSAALRQCSTVIAESRTPMRSRGAASPQRRRSPRPRALERLGPPQRPPRAR
jgi:hypothetical protein